MECPGTIWSIRRVVSEVKYFDVFTTTLGPLEVSGVKILYPFYSSPRMIAQSALFTIQEDPWKDMEQFFPCQLPDEHFDLAELVRFEVPAHAKGSCLLQLEGLGVNNRTLYPDLDGIAEGLWQTIVLRSGHEI
jgi:hypothetical protein